MPTEQYHEPANELGEDVRTYARVCTSLVEEAEAINWYAQRLAIERDDEAAAIMRAAERVLFQPGDIVENGDAAEAAFEAGGAPAAADGSLGIGSLKGRER